MRLVRSFWKKVRSKTLGFVAVVLIVIVAGPELVVSIELFALLSAMGAGLFLFAFGGAQVRFYTSVLRTWVERIDPYFFVPTSTQLRALPGIVAHAIPLYVLVLVSGLIGAIVALLNRS